MLTLEDLEACLADRSLLREVQGNKNMKQQILGIYADSRQVLRGGLFICKGAAFRPAYLKEASERGCIAYLSEVPYPEEAGEIAGFIVTDIRKAMAAASAFVYQYEPEDPKITGITGTKGKTTTAWYLKAMLDEWALQKGEPETALISTVEYYDGRLRRDAIMTTPEAPDLHHIIRTARDSGARYLTMEVSSQALKYKRVRELCFQVGVFLNISEDHISPNEHTDFEDYFSAKLSIFRQSRTACVNLDADHAERIVKAARKSQSLVTFGRHPSADIRLNSVRQDGERIAFQVSCERFCTEFHLGMRGRFNVENALAAIAAAYVYGVPLECMKKALEETFVPGRMENYYSRDGRICGIVDFAHNRLSFEKMFDAAYREYGSYKNIITIFGCPGGKAFNRRQELGTISGLFSDYVFITDDDPGDEPPRKIAEEVEQYVELTGCPSRIIEDREKAVEAAVGMAKESEEKTLILLLGRGCEKYQQINGMSIKSAQDAYLMKKALERI